MLRPRLQMEIFNKTIPTLLAARGISPFGTFWKHPEAHSGYSQASKLDLSDKIASGFISNC